MYVDQTDIRNKTKELFHKKLDAAIRRQSFMFNEYDELQIQLKSLKHQLDNYQGKKVYGYLSKDLKDEVDEILKTMMKEKDLSDLYSMWNDINRAKLSVYYTKQNEDIPIEENKEFRSLKNEIIRSALSLTTDENNVQARAITRQLFFNLLQLLSNSYDNKYDRLNSQIDSKLRAKISEKKQAQGIKTDNSINQNSFEQSI